MILISKFKDYWDSLAHQLRDNRIVYDRKQEEFSLNYSWYNGNSDLINYLKDKTLIQMVLNASCDIKRSKEEYEYRPFGGAAGYSFEGTGSIHICGKIYKFLVKKPRGYDSTLEFTYISQEESALAQYLNEKIAPILAFSPFNLGLSSSNTFTINPCLKTFKFPEHPYEVVQQLMKFLRPKENVMLEVSDKYKAQAHGFDKHSFRREPGGPTRKRKKLSN